MVKILGSLFIIISASIAGFEISFQQKKRCNSLIKLIKLTKYIYTEAAFTKKRANLIMSEASSLYNLDFLCDVCKNLKNSGINKAFNAELERYSPKMALSKNDLTAASGIPSIFSYISEEQKSNADSVLKLLEISLNEAKQNYEKNAKLIRSSGILFGLLTVILLF